MLDVVIGTFSTYIVMVTNPCTAHIHGFVPENVTCQIIKYANRYIFH